MVDIIIIGGGPAGMAAALYALREGKSVTILEKENFGGQIASSPRLENFPSIQAISGLDFSNNLFEQITKLGCEFELEDVTSVTKKDEVFTINTNYGVHEAKTVIIATGVQHRKINVEREDELVGHGVSYCSTCDGAFFKGQDVVVIGDANSALQYALDLSSYCNSVKICTLFDKWFADKALIDKLDVHKNISYEHNLNLVSFNGTKDLESLTFRNTKTDELETINCKGCFIAIGQVPNNKIFETLVDLDHGFVITNDKMETKTPGLYAIGDCRKKETRQVITALSDGAIAAINIIKYLS